jgi:hypothetical protein
LRTQPERQGGNLRDSQVDINAMQIVPQNQTGNGFSEAIQIGVVAL